MDSLGVTIVMLVVTVYVLFIDDLVTIVGADRSSGHDTMVFVFLILKVIVFVMFLVELVATSWADRKYFLSFFFWLDVLALVSLVPDVLLLFGFDLFSSISGLTVARTGRVARASARAARLVRVVRVIKISRFIGQQHGASTRGWLDSGDDGADAAERAAEPGHVSRRFVPHVPRDPDGDRRAHLRHRAGAARSAHPAKLGRAS